MNCLIRTLVISLIAILIGTCLYAQKHEGKKEKPQWESPKFQAMDV
jgi:hypothetical protein